MKNLFIVSAGIALCLFIHLFNGNNTTKYLSRFVISLYNSFKAFLFRLVLVVNVSISLDDVFSAKKTPRPSPEKIKLLKICWNHFALSFISVSKDFSKVVELSDKSEMFILFDKNVTTCRLMPRNRHHRSGVISAEMDHPA